MNELHKSLAILQEKVKATKTLHNGYANFNYRNVESIYESAKPILKELGLTLTLSDEIVLIGDRFYIKATATISNGTNSLSVSAFARESLDKRGMDSAQITGSCSSYARKYALGGLLLLDDNKDIDSQDNIQTTPPPAQKASNQKNEILQVKKEIATKLKEKGVVTSQAIIDFFNFVGVEKNDLQQLKDLLNSEHFESSIDDFVGASTRLANEGV